MCGIVGAVSARNIVPILVQGLQRLEYRGYDSCGVAVHQNGGLRRARSTSRVSELGAQVDADKVSGGTGIAHTRWATHGVPAVHNAHPHFSHGPGLAAPSGFGDLSAGQGVSGATASSGHIALVHNGIIENHEELRAELQGRGYVFASQTDTEVIAHLIDHLYAGDLFEAVKQAIPRLHGAFAIAVFCKDEPNRVIGARLGSPLVLGVGVQAGAHENFLASDAMALAGVTDRIVYLEDGDVVDLAVGQVLDRRAQHRRGGSPFKRVEREVRTVQRALGCRRAGPLPPLHAKRNLRAAARHWRHA